MMKKRILLWFLVTGFAFFLPFAQAAQNYDLKQITPEIQQALDGRRARFQELQRLKAENLIGENKEGFTATLKDLPELKPLVDAENQDRAVIYRALADQNQLGPQGLEEIRRVFAEVQRGKARPGEFVQLPSGEWIRK